MNTLFYCILSIGLFCCILGCNEPQTKNTTHVTNTDSSKPIPYPFDYCIVTEEKLDSMGDPIVKVYEGQEVKFCCKGCIKKFEADQETYLKKIKKG
ncbi:MAG: YHS domain-containing protein [Planctomycetota bacterium]